MVSIISRPSNKIAQGLSSISYLSIRDQIMVWHCRLGHPSFSYLKHLFPVLFKRLILYHFNVKVVYWQRANVKLTFQNPTMHQNYFIFFHSDVWGSSKVTTISEKKNGL